MQTETTAGHLNAISSGEITRSLEKLQHLLYSGAITDAEYEASKAKLLGTHTPDDPFAQVAKLSELHRDGVLGDVEFAAAKARVLGLYWKARETDQPLRSGACPSATRRLQRSTNRRYVALVDGGGEYWGPVRRMRHVLRCDVSREGDVGPVGLAVLAEEIKVVIVLVRLGRDRATVESTDHL